jgi:hypothetical protein
MRAGWSFEQAGRATLLQVAGILEDLPYIDPDFAQAQENPKKTPPPSSPTAARDRALQARNGSVTFEK